MVRVGSRKYREFFPKAKMPVGRPSKKEKWDPIANYINLFKGLGERADEERIDELVNAMSNRKVMNKYSNGKMYKFLVRRRKEFLTKLLKEGLSNSPLKHIVPHVERTRNFDRILFLLRFYGSESKKIVTKLYIVGKLNS